MEVGSPWRGLEELVWTGSDRDTLLCVVALTHGSCLLSSRYHVLVSKYGHLAPLAQVDLRPRSTLVKVRCGERMEAVSLRLQLSVLELKKQLSDLLQLPHNGTRLFYVDQEMCSVLGPQELRCGSRALHSYGIRDGDEILVVPKMKARCSSSGL